MVIKIKYLLLLLIFSTGFFAYAQANNSQPQADLPDAVLDTSGTVNPQEASSYFIRETEEGVRFIQRIEWEPVNNVLHYEVIVDQRYGNSDRYNEVIRQSVEKPFLEVSIPPGDYRFKVRVYNLLNRLDGESDYLYFNVFKAVQPLIRGMTPDHFYLDESQPRRITLLGDNFVLGAKIFMAPSREGSTDISETQRGAVIPADIRFSDLGDSVELIFNEQDLLINNYRIIVVNPGGLSSTYDYLTVRFQKPFDINVHAGYAPLIPLSAGSLHNTYYDVFNNTFYPIGFTAKASFIPYKQVFGYLGVEVSPYYNYVKTDKDTYIAQTNIIGATLFFLYQKPFFGKKLVLNARAGGGFASYLNMYFDYKNGIESEPMNTWFPAAEAGASVQYFVYKKAFVELGLNMKLFFADEMPTIHLGPVLTAGWQF